MTASMSLVRTLCSGGAVSSSNTTTPRRHSTNNKGGLIHHHHRRLLGASSSSSSSSPSPAIVVDVGNDNRIRGSFIVASAEASSSASSSSSSSSAGADGMYNGTVFFHLYPELTDPKPIFNTFLEGALHCCEVAKSHPAYATAHFHEAYDQEDAAAGKCHAYFNMSLFSCPPEELWNTFEDLHECLGLGHLNQEHHPLPCRELACAPGPGSAIAAAPHGSVKYTEKDAVVLVAVPRGHALDVEQWSQWSGADEARTLSGIAFLESTIFECVDATAKYSHVIRTEMGAVDAAAVEAAVKAAKEGVGEGAVVGAYRCAFNIEKKGAPAGALPAVREMAKKKKESEEETRDRLAADGKSGTV